MGSFKNVAMIVRVPNSKYCAQFQGMDSPHCEYFDNYGGRPTCSKGFDHHEKCDDGHGYLLIVTGKLSAIF